MSMKTEEQPDGSRLRIRKGSAEGLFCTGFAKGLKNEFGDVLIVATDLNELVQFWYSITDDRIDISGIKTVAIFHETDVKLKDPEDAESVKSGANG